MLARGGVTCQEVLRCDDITCKAWRYKATAEQRGETHCLCGRPFHRTEFRPIGGVERAASRGQAQAKAKAKAGAKAKAKAQAARHAAGPRAQGQEPPWRRPRAGSRTRSPTGGRSGGRRAASGGAAAESNRIITIHVDPKRTGDPLHQAETYLNVARGFGDETLLAQAQANKQKALKAKADSLSPRQRAEHLRKHARQAEEDLTRRHNAVESTEMEIDVLQARLKIEVEERDDQENVVQDLKIELQRADDQIRDTVASPRPVGRQVQGGNDGLVKALEQIKAHCAQAAGGSLPDHISRNFDISAMGIAEALSGVFGGAQRRGRSGGGGPQGGRTYAGPGVRQQRGRQARQGRRPS